MKRVARRVRRNCYRVFLEMELQDYLIGSAICLALMVIIPLVCGA